MSREACGCCTSAARIPRGCQCRGGTWCRRAEESRVAALREFSISLRAERAWRASASRNPKAAAEPGALGGLFHGPLAGLSLPVPLPGARRVLPRPRCPPMHPADCTRRRGAVTGPVAPRPDAPGRGCAARPCPRGCAVRSPHRATRAGPGPVRRTGVEPGAPLRALAEGVPPAGCRGPWRRGVGAAVSCPQRKTAACIATGTANASWLQIRCVFSALFWSFFGNPVSVVVGALGASSPGHARIL